MGLGTQVWYTDQVHKVVHGSVSTGMVHGPGLQDVPWTGSQAMVQGLGQ